MPTSPRPAPGPLMRTIAAVLRARYPERGFTQETLGHVIGVSQSQMSLILLGERSVDVDQLQALCDVLGLDIVEVIGSAESR